MRTAILIVALCLPACCGCGTFADALCGPGGGGPYYRGVRMDVEAIRQGHPLAPLLAADVPLSAAADTALVPYIAHRQWKEGQQPEAADE